MRDLIVTLIVIGVIPYALARPHIGLLLFAWISYMNPHRLSWGFAYHFPFAAISAAVVFLGLLFSKEPKRIPITPVTIFWLLFVMWPFITTYFSLVPEDAHFGWVRFVKIQVMVLVTLMLITSKERIFQFIWIIVISIGFFGVKGGIFTVLSGGNFRVWGPPGSFIEGNNELALALIMVLPLMRFLQMESKNKWVRWGLLLSMLFCGFAILSSYSRGAFLAAAAMLIVFWLKSKKKLIIGIALVSCVIAGLGFMPDEWFDRMNTIQTYQEDSSAMGRINAWWFAFNVANDRPLVGGGFHVFNRELFYQYAPIPEDFHDAHSIYLEVLGEHGYVGLFLFLSMWFLAYRTGTWIKKHTKKYNNLAWSSELASMLQVGMVGYAVGGTFLGLAYFDLPYHFMALMVLTRFVVEKELSNLESTKQEETAIHINSNRLLRP